MVLLTKADQGMVTNNQIENIEAYCRKEGIAKMRILGIPYNDKPADME